MASSTPAAQTWSTCSRHISSSTVDVDVVEGVVEEGVGEAVGAVVSWSAALTVGVGDAGVVVAAVVGPPVVGSDAASSPPQAARARASGDRQGPEPWCSCGVVASWPRPSRRAVRIGCGAVCIRYARVDGVSPVVDTAAVGIAVLGPLAISGDGGSLAPRDRVVLAALTVRRGDVVSAAALADALWRDHPPATWSKQVQASVVRLRRALGAAAIETVADGYRLVVPSDEIDAHRFQRLVAEARELNTVGASDRAAHQLGAALALWRGPPLAELDGWEPGRIEAARLEELRREAEEARLDAALRAGLHREVLAEAKARVAEEPLREHRWALLALAQYQSGQQADALRTIREARRRLAEELGLEPGPTLAPLEEAILQQDPSLAAATALPEPSATCPYQGLVPYDLADAETFFGRDAELSECLRRLADGGVLVVVGPSGSGKSSLIRAGVAAALERDGRRVVVITPGAHPMSALALPRRRRPVTVLVVDQCEEAVSLCVDGSERSRFFAALAELSRPVGGRAARRPSRRCGRLCRVRRARGARPVLAQGDGRGGDPRRDRGAGRARPGYSSSRDSSICSSATSKASPGRCRCCRTLCCRHGPIVRAAR